MTQRLTVHNAPTPALVIDLPIVERNLARMASYTRQHGLNLHNHVYLKDNDRQFEMVAVDARERLS